MSTAIWNKLTILAGIGIISEIFVYFRSIGYSQGSLQCDL